MNINFLNMQKIRKLFKNNKKIHIMKKVHWILIIWVKIKKLPINKILIFRKNRVYWLVIKEIKPYVTIKFREFKRLYFPIF